MHAFTVARTNYFSTFFIHLCGIVIVPVRTEENFFLPFHLSARMSGKSWKKNFIEIVTGNATESISK